jgi:two-component system KDP operon response regulator KdpE
VDVLAHKVTLNDAPVKLTPKEFDLLAILVRNAGRLLTHRQILASVWGSAHTEDLQYLRVFIGQLRQKLKTSPDAAELILTEPGIGYRLNIETG